MGGVSCEEGTLGLRQDDKKGGGRAETCAQGLVGKRPHFFSFKSPSEDIFFIIDFRNGGVGGET